VSRASELGAAILFFAAAACTRAPSTAPAPDAAANVAVAPPAPAPTDAASSDAGIASLGCEDGIPRSGKSIGHTSVVLKVELSTGKKAAWKPNARKVKGRYKGEIAAYRLAGALGIPNVPPVCFRSFDASAATTALASNEQARSLFADQAIVEQGAVRGAVIPWIEGLQFWALEKDPARSDVRRWLTAKATIPPDKLDLARQASTLAAFDFITGNWDRYSGGNVGLDKTGTVVLYIDNDGAFMEGPAQEALARNRARVDSADRFSSSFVERVRTLAAGGEDELLRVFGEESAGTPLLSRSVVGAVAARMKVLVGVLDAKTKAHGEGETLFFP
jgi:hypothetical protein